MPKVVDHEARRVEVYEATWRVIQRVGLEAATTREIAKEAGLSLGALNHYFANKAELLLSAHELGFARAQERMIATGQGLQGMRALRHALFESLPLDEERLLEAQVDMAFLGHALADERLARVRLNSHKRTLQWLSTCLAEARGLGEVTTARDDGEIADEYLALVDGSSMAAVLYGSNKLRRQRLVALADAFLGRLGSPAPTDGALSSI